MLMFLTRPSFWIALAWLAFAVLPSQALHYGWADSTPEERWQAMGWNGAGLAWSWFGSLALFFVSPRIVSLKKRSWLELAHVGLSVLWVFGSAKWANIPLGYAIIFLLIAFGAVAVNALSRLAFFSGDRFLLASFLIVLLLVGGAIFYPILSVLITLFEGKSWAILQQSYLLRLIFNSLSVSATVGFFATFFGFAFALYTTRIAKQGRWVGKFLSILPMVTPPFVVGLGVSLMLGRSGYLTPFLIDYLGFSQNWLYGFNGIVISHTLALTPMAFMMLEGALRSINATLEEASYTLRASRWQTFNAIIFPLLKPALANAFLVVSVQSLADFSTPFVLGGNFDVLASQIYFYLVGTQLDYGSASLLGTILLIFSLMIFLIQYYWIGRKSYVTVSGRGYRGHRQPLARGMIWLIFALLIIWGGFTLLLYGSIFYGSFTVNWGVDHSLTLNNYLKLFGQGWDRGAFPSLIQTLLYALIAAPFTAIFGFLLAYLLKRKQFWGRQGIEFIALLCFAVPGTVAGLSYVVAFNHAPLYLTGTGAIIVLSMVMRNMPIGMRACVAGLEQIDKALDEASFSLKGNSFQTLREIIFPLLKPALLSALVTSFVRSMTTISAIIFLVTPSTRVATAFILNRVEDGDYGQAVAYGATLIVVMMLIIGLFHLLLGRKNED